MNNKPTPLRNSRLQIPVSNEELEQVNKKASDCGMNTATFCRFIILKSEIRVE